MIPITTAEHLKLIDKNSIDDDGIPSAALMESAGAQVALTALDMLEGILRPSVEIYCGGGQNGGDGFVAARHLINRGVEVQVYCTRSHHDYKGDAALMLKVLKKTGVEPICLDESLLETLRPSSDLIIDALLGIGSRGPARGLIGSLLNTLQSFSIPRLAVDMASGLQGDHSTVDGPTLNADVTLSIGALKPAQIFPPASFASGRVQWTPIGFSRQRLEECPWQLIEEHDVWPGWPLRMPHGHKGQGGKVLVWAGSQGMMGAGYLACEAARRGGASMVCWICPESQAPIAQSLCPSATVLLLPEIDGGELDVDAALKRIVDKLPWSNALVIGPGIGTSISSGKVLSALLPQIQVPLVLDADGLNLMAREGTLQKLLPPFSILTPHLGEAKRLFGPPPSAGHELLNWAGQIAHRHRLCLHLKGAPSLTASPSGEVFVNSTGNAILSSAGSGDVLSGLIGALLAIGVRPPHAVIMAAHLHGACADRRREQKGPRGHCVEDLLEEIPAVLQEKCTWS